MLVDGIVKVFKPAPVVDSFTQLGFPVHLAVAIGILEIACVALYAFPRTAPLGIIVLTGYLGGAVATQVRAEMGLVPTVFPIVLGVLLWVGLLLRDDRIRALLAPRG
jgi:hypothetical protein